MYYNRFIITANLMVIFVLFTGLASALPNKRTVDACVPEEFISCLRYCKDKFGTPENAVICHYDGVCECRTPTRQ
ncbi:hypothetical protein K492DRAFT_173424 [Lichtheimia hyalospora FSU 10163]|nr:hypothetical protein K492DRAFT_173424 [Lichtheimia hyalospora FSU 10163]